MAESVELMGGGDVGGGSLSLSEIRDDVQEKPEGVPDKFWNSDKGEIDSTSLLASYSELEKKLGSPEPPESESPQLDIPSESNSFDLGKYEQEYSDNDSSLKEETYVELKSKFGLDKTEVDKYIAYRQADSEAFNHEIFAMAGGEKSYQGVMSWASNNLSKEEIAKTNSMLETGDKDQVRVGVMKLVNKHREAVGAEPIRSLSGNTSEQGSGVKPFASLQQAVEARKDKRFETDPAYRQQWERRVGSSPFISRSK